MSLPLNERMKLYERVSHHCLTRRSCCIIRVDGRAFHTLTRSMQKPFDANFMDAMEQGVRSVAEEMSGFQLAYTQSDEASFLLTDFETIDTQPWFDYDLQKLVSISASLMTCRVAQILGVSLAFDARAFVVPRDEAANYFVWRAKDWARNSLQMFCRAHFSHQQLHEKDREAMHEMLHQIGKNWTTDCTQRERNGAFGTKTEQGLAFDYSIQPSYESISPLMECLNP